MDTQPPLEPYRHCLLAGLPVVEPQLDAGGVSTAVLEGGDGPPVMLLHGPGESAVNWRWTIPEVATSHRVVAADLPAHGSSGAGDGGRATRHAASLLIDAKLWESAFTTAYDAFRTAADAVVLFLGYRVPATRGGHRIATDIAHAAMQPDTDAFAPAPNGSGRADTSRSTSTQRAPSTRPSLTRDGQSNLPAVQSMRSSARCQLAEGSASSIGMGTIGQLSTVAWNEPSPFSSQLASRIVTWTGRPSRGSTASIAA